MLKEYLNERNISIYALSKDSGVAYSTLNDIANAKVEIDNCKIGILKSLALTLCITLEEMYDNCSGQQHIRVNTVYDVLADVSVRNKSYYVSFRYKDVPVELELCRVNNGTTRYIRYIAAWRAEEYIREQRMNDPWNTF